ncbi:MAG: hypothetical protein IIX17_01595 [Tidjanibacter sp.]|nr:hypothetical protein [Tidjanibacter sp.]
MKRVFATTVCLCLMLLCGTQAKAQLNSTTYLEQWKYAFSEEGKQHWKPEFTARAFLGPYEGGLAVTGGVRVDNKRTLGGRITISESGSTLMPSEYFITLSANYRKYLHFGPREIISLYSDFHAGLGIIYKTDKAIDPEIEPAKPGSMGPILGVQPGIRLRLVENIHLFAGVSLSNLHVGLHLGVGF